MGIISKFFEALLDPKAATWSAGVSFNRSNPLPLDKWSVFQSMDAAVAYAETNAVAYPGQVVAVYHNGKMVAYVLSEVVVDEEHSKLALEPIGVIPTGEGAIEVTEDGVISIGVDGVTLEVIDGALTLVGFEEAPEGAQLVKAADGTLNWVKPDTTTVEGLATAVETLKADIEKLEQQLNPTDEEGNPIEGGIVADVKDLEDAVGAEAVYNENGELVSEATGIFKDIEEIEDKIGSAAEYDNEGSLVAAATGLYVELDKKIDAEEAEAALNLKADIDDVEEAIESVNAEIAKKANAEEVEAALDLKANAADVYTKDEADASAESIVKGYVATLDHLERKIVVSYEQIDPNEDDADRFIYMVPNDRNSYDEYMVINGAVEKVGDWDIDLSDYAKTEDVNAALDLKANAQAVTDALALKANAQDVTDALALKADIASVNEELAKKADVTSVNEELAKKADVAFVNEELAKKVAAVDGYRLMAVSEGEKLANIADGAEVNYINDVDAEFNVNEGKLELVAISQDKVTGLNDELVAITDELADIDEAIENINGNIITINTALDTKVTKVDGSRLITNDEAKKLEKLALDGDDVVISGTVNANNVQELYANVVRIVTNDGSYEYDGEQKTLLNIQPGAEVNIINSVSNEFAIDENRKLTVNIIDATKIDNLNANTAFAKVVEDVAKNASDIVIINTNVGKNASDILTINTTLTEYMAKTDADIVTLQEILTWKDI